MSPAFVYGSYDQTALDAQYEQRTLVTAPAVDGYIREWRDSSERVRIEHEVIADLDYGPGERERVDIFPVAAPDAPMVLFVHGGAWRRLSKDEFSYPAPGFLQRGIAFAVAGFGLVPAVTLAEQVDQVRRALAWVHANASRFRIDAKRIHLLGNSSGGHLAGMLMGAGEAPLARGALLVSGIYDLEPVRLSSRNDYLDLDPASARSLSPITRIPSGGRPLIVGWGERELDEFQRQSREFAAAWGEQGGPVHTVVRPTCNHFDMTTELGQPESPVLQAFLEMIAASE